MLREKNKIILTFIIFCTTLPVLLFSQGYINLSQTNDFSELPYIIALPNGNLIAAWTDLGHYNGGGSLVYKTHTSNGWSTMKVIDNNSCGFAQLALDSSGNVHMVYWGGAGSYVREIYYRKYSGNTWSNKELVYYSPGLNSSFPRIQVEGNKVYVIWVHNYAKPMPCDIVFTEKTIGGSWPSNYQNVSHYRTSFSGHPTLTVRNGHVYAAWMDDNHSATNWNIYFSDRVLGSWSSPKRLVPSFNQYWPSMVVDGTGNLHLIYSGNAGPVSYMKKTGISWSSPKIISTAGTSPSTLIFLKYAAGRLHGVWRQREGDKNYIYYGCGTVDGNWENPIKVSHSGYSEYPCVDVDNSGKVHIVYSDIGVGNERDIFYVSLDQVTSYPVASYTAIPSQGEAPLYVNFDASESYDPDGKIVTYKWNFGDGNQGTGITTSHTYTNKGVRTATLTITDNDENSSSSSQEITVGTPPIANFSASPTSGVSPLTVNFDASESYDPDGNIVSYKWDFGDGTSGSGKSPIHTYTNLATRTAILTVTDDEGLTNQASIEIEISSSPVARIKYSPRTGESPLKVDFDASNSKPADKANGSITKYEWDFGDGKNGYGEKISHTFTKSETFIVTLEITDDQGLNDSTTVEVEVYSKPVASFSCSALEGIAPITITFDASKSSDEDGKIGVYKWLFGDGTIGYGKIITHTYSKGGNFNIILTVIDNDGWTGTATKIIKIIEKPYPPLNLTLKHIINNGLFFTDYINLLEWQKNNKNTGKINPKKYLIYCKKENSNQDFIYIGEVNNNTFKFEIFNFPSEEDMKSYIYGIRTVDWHGRESDMAITDRGK